MLCLIKSAIVHSPSTMWEWAASAHSSTPIFPHQSDHSDLRSFSDQHHWHGRPFFIYSSSEEKGLDNDNERMSRRRGNREGPVKDKNTVQHSHLHNGCPHPHWLSTLCFCLSWQAKCGRSLLYTFSIPFGRVRVEESRPGELRLTLIFSQHQKWIHGEAESIKQNGHFEGKVKTFLTILCMYLYIHSFYCL